MLFNSFEFLLFLPITFLLYWFVFKQLKSQNLFIVAASYLFYGWWDWKFLILIAITTLFSYFSGVLIARYEGNRGKQKFVSSFNIILNLAILGVFKYYNFFSDSFANLANSVGWDVDWVTLDILLPVGISFYTFQALSYSIDIYQKKMPVCRDMVSFFAYISFFPQLVAGPIERATNLLPQFYKQRKFDYSQAVDGCRQILWGFFKKMVVADNCAHAANLIWDNYTEHSGFTLLLGAIFFTFQIYGDFSGYSDIAIGTARLFGINLMRNFNFPYFSRDIAEFWRRWHISLTTWFRDYIYIPLGGSRCSKSKVFRNTMIIFLVSGFWHGANWTFIAWGAYHALLFIPLLLVGNNRKFTNTVAKDSILPSVIEVGQMLSTFMLALIGWVIFRANTISEAWDYLSIMFSGSLFDITSTRTYRLTMWCILILLIIEWLQRNRQHAMQIEPKGAFKYRAVRLFFYAILVFAIYLFSGQQATFIYFQF